MLKTDFCVIGFPKCGTTAVVSLLAASPDLNITAGRTKEFPYYIRSQDPGPLDYVEGKRNGHKFSGYIYNNDGMTDLLAENPEALLIITVRSAESALMSWRQMHRSIAKKNTVEHLTTKDRASRKFFKNCTIDEYYESYAKRRLKYAQHIENLLTRFPSANYVVIAQRRLSEDAATVMTELHERMGLTPSPDYIAGLPDGHKARGVRAPGSSGVSEEIAKVLVKRDAELAKLLSRLEPSRVMLAADGGF